MKSLFFVGKWEDKIFSKSQEGFGHKERKGRMDFSLVCKLGFVNGWCLYGGSRLWGGGLWWFEVVWGGGGKVVRWREWEQRKGKCKGSKFCKEAKVCQGASKHGIYRILATMEAALVEDGRRSWGKNGGKNISFKLSFKGMVQSMARYGFKHG